MPRKGPENSFFFKCHFCASVFEWGYRGERTTILSRRRYATTYNYIYTKFTYSIHFHDTARRLCAVVNLLVRYRQNVSDIKNLSTGDTLAPLQRGWKPFFGGLTDSHPQMTSHALWSTPCVFQAIERSCNIIRSSFRYTLPLAVVISLHTFSNRGPTNCGFDPI